MLLPSWLNPFKKRSIKACLGNCSQYEVICSGMIAHAFQKVDYPIVPVLSSLTTREADTKMSPYGEELQMRHYSQIMPRDFDLSPNFEIIKFNIIENRNFNYKSLIWNEEKKANIPLN